MLHVLEALEGGTARHVIDVVTHAVPARHVVVTPAVRHGGFTDERARPAIEAAGGTVITIDMRRSPASWRNPVALGRLHHLVRELRPDVVHGHSTIGGALGRIAAGRGPVRIYTPNGFNTSVAVRLAERALDPLTDVLIAVSASEAADLSRAGLGRDGRLVTISNGIDLAPPSKEGAPDLRSRLGLPAATPLVGTIARLVPQKAPERFVAVGRRVVDLRPEVHLVLIGSGRLEAEVERQIDALGLRGRLHRIPGISEAHRVLGQLNVFVLTSRFEGGAYTPLEAMRSGVPVVLSDVVGNRDVVEDGVSGRVLAGDDTEGIAQAVVSLVEDRDRAEAMVAAARDRLAARFDVRTMGASLSRLYSESVDQYRGRR